MNKLDRAKFIMDALNKEYPNTPIPLDHVNIYTLLVAVLLSAQCTDKRVNQVTPQLFTLASDPLSMTKLSVETIYEIIKPCGLGPKKSRAISELSQKLVFEYDQKVPECFEALEQLPGVGHKTASVVMSQGYSHPAFPVDTHIHRLSQRWGLSNGKNVQKTEKDLKKIFPESSWNKLHLQIIYWGREYCQARACFGLECYICSSCYPRRKTPFKHKKT